MLHSVTFEYPDAGVTIQDLDIRLISDSQKRSVEIWRILS